MGKFTAVEDDIFSIFAAQQWKDEAIVSLPANFSPAGLKAPYIRVCIVQSGSGVNKVSVSGMLIVDIFTSVGEGPRPASLIADKLEQYLAYKSIMNVSNSTTQFQGGSFTPKERDYADPLLFRSSYSIPFNYFGVQ